MIPFQKIFALLIRTFSKPMLGYLKQRQQENRMVALRWVFVGVGRHYHRFEHWLNHKILKTTHKSQITELKEEILLEKGIEAIYELFFYGIVIGVPLYELYVAAVSAQKKEQKLQDTIVRLEKQLRGINDNLNKALKSATERNSQKEELEKEKIKILSEMVRKREQLWKQKDNEYYRFKQEEEQQIKRKLMEEQLNNMTQSEHISSEQQDEEGGTLRQEIKSENEG